MHGIQAWVALPEEDEETDPCLRASRRRRSCPPIEGAGLWARLIAGEAFGAKAQGQDPLADVLRPLATSSGAQGAAAGRIRRTRRLCRVGHGRSRRAALSRRARCWCSRRARGRRFTATEPSDRHAARRRTVGQRFIEWNFVSSSKERIEQAKADWRAGRMKLPDLDNQEFIPLPPDPPPPTPMS